MSHPHYNPYASGNQSSNQGQYEVSSMQPERDLRRDIPGFGPGSSFNPPPASSPTPANHGGNIPSLLNPPVNYRPEQSRARVNVGDMERSVDSHISRAREEVRCLDRPAQPIGQSTRFTHTQSDEILSSGTGTTSYPMSSTFASVGRRHAEVESSSSSLDWLPKYKRPTADDSTKSYSLPASSSYTSSGDVGRFKTSSDRERDGQSIPGLGDYDYPEPDKPAAPTETSHHKYTSESAANILLNFGLEKEDLEFLISYPEEQITPENLPFLLRQIRTQKINRAMTAVESKPYPQPQPIRVVSERDSLTSSGGSSAVLQPNKVIDYGHTSKYVGGVGDEIGRTSGRSANSDVSGIGLFLDEQRSSSDSPEQLKTDTEIRSIPVFFSRDQSSSVTSDRSSYTSILRPVAPASSVPMQQFQTQPDQTSKPIFNSFSLPKKDEDRKVLTSEALKPSPLKEPETKRQLTLKSQQSSKVLDNVYPGRRGLVVIDKIYTSAAKDESETRGQDSGFCEQMIKLLEETQQKQKAPKQHVQKQPAQEQLAQMQPTKKQLAQIQQKEKQLAQLQQTLKQLSEMQPAQMQPTHEQRAKKQPAQTQPAQMQPAQTEKAQTQQLQKQPVSQLGKVLWPTVYPTVNPSYCRPIVNPPASLQPSPNTWNSVDSILKHLVKVPGIQNQPTPAMMYDYAAATPTVFPHTCSLCYKECFTMKDWISHQNSILHLNSCKYVRTLYPQWSGEIVLEPSDAGKDATPSTSASAQTSQKREEKTSVGSRSRSPSPRRRHSPDSSREKRSLSRSSRGSSYGRSRSPSHDRSRSRSYERSRKRERRSSSRRRGDRRSTPRRRGDKRSSPRRSRERWSSPRRTRERLSSPRRRDDRWSSSRRRGERWSLSRRREERRSLSRRRDERRSLSRRRDERRSCLRRSRESRSSSESSPERRSSSADRLVKKVLEKSDVKSLSKPSDVEAVVKTLFAEIAKMKSLSSSSSTKGGKPSKSTPSAGKKSSTSAASLSSSASKAKKTTAMTASARASLQASRASASTKTRVGDTKQISKKPRSEPPNVSEGDSTKVKVEEKAKTSDVETKGRDTKVAKSKLKPKAKCVNAEAKQAKGAEPMELGEAGVDVAEPMEVESCAEGKETNVEAVSDKPSESQPPTRKDETGPPTVQTADEASSQVPEPESTAPESTELSAASGLGTKMEASRAPSSTEEGEKKNTKDPASAEKNQRDPTSASVSTEPAAGTVSEEQAATATSSPAAVPSLTIGEMVEKHFRPDKIKCLSKKFVMSRECSRRLLMISNLPKFHEGCYTEDDIVDVLIPFGLKYWGKKIIYVIPQARVAFVLMPSGPCVRRALSARQDVIAIKKNRLSLHVLEDCILMDPIGFYAALMRWMDTRMDYEGYRTVYIRNISQSEARDLREALRKIDSVANYLPLLNKVFIEFESGRDADRLGVWCSLLKQAPSYIVFRLKALNSTFKALTPKLPEKAIPDSKDAVAWATTPSQNFGVPQGSTSPFWITMSTIPFVFPTISPWFTIPEYLTVKGDDDIKKANSRGSMFPTLMFTGLPEGGYRQDDVAKLVWPYFPKQTLHSLYYNVLVLTLQRRAFVHFSDWTSCCDFVRDHTRKPVSVRGCVLKIHFVLENMYPESKEELMYKSLMKWSNSRVPETGDLEERLLCVEISEASVAVVKAVMRMVASIAKFVSFLPLANRICVEMADSSGVGQVLEKYRLFSPNPRCDQVVFRKGIGFQSLNTFKKRLEASRGASINLDLGSVRTEAKPPKQPLPSGLSDKGQHPVLQTSIPASAKPAGDVPMEDVEKLGAELATDSTSAPKANEDVNAADGDTVPAAPGPTSSATSLPKSNETTTEHPPIDPDTVVAVLAAVRQHRLAQERTQRGSQDDVTDVLLTTDDQPLNLSEFVTVDEVGDDVEETNPAQEASRGQGDAKKRKQEEESAESCKSPKDIEEADDQIPKDEDQPLKVCSNKDSDVTEQETFEILIIDDQMKMDHHGQNTEALSDQMSTDISHIEEEEDAFKVVDSVKDQPTTTESESDNKKPDATSRRDDRSSKRSGLRTRASKSEEKVKSPEKQDRMVKRSETSRDTTARLPKRDQDTEEEKVSEMVDSTEEELVQEAAATERTDRRRSGRGKKEDKMTLNLTEASEKPDEDEEASYEILDSVEDETATEEPAVMTRSTRGRRGRTTKKDQTKKEDTPTRRRRTPARESQEKTPKMEKEASSKGNSPTKKSDITVREEIDEDATYEILDSVEDEVLKDDRPSTGGKRKRGRPKKEVKSTRKDTVTLKGDKEADDEEKVSYQILEAVKDEMVEDQPPTEQSPKNEEEEPVHQIVDSVEDDRVQEELMTTEVSKDETCPKEEAPTCSTIVLEASEKVVAEDLESGNDPSAAEESGVDKKERSPKIDIKKEDTSTTKSQGDAATPAEEKNQQSSSKSDTIAVKSALLNLDEVRDEEDDSPEDTPKAEELRERQAAAEEKQLAKEQERKTREKDGREQRSRSGRWRWKAKERGKEQEVVGSTELVTLDEVGADEAREETVAQCREPDVEIRARELQGLVTLDEIVDAEEGEVEQSTLEPRPPIKEDHTVETLEEAGDDEEGNLDEAEKTSRPVKRRINDDTEESTTFVTVDEVGEVEEEGKKEAPRTRGRPKKRTRKTPVRKSTRGKKVVAEEQPESGSDAPPPTSLDASSSLDKDPSTLSSDSQQEIQKALLEGAGHSDIDAASAGQDLQPEAPENQRLEGEEAIEGRCRADVEVPSKRKREPVGPEAKRSRSLSPSVSIKLPPFSPSNPLGPEFLVPKLGYFCNLCHVFCLHESSAKDAHCSSQTHYDNLQNHYEKLQPEPSTENSQASFSD